MIENKLSWFQLLLGAALGLVGIFSASILLQVLGGVALLITAVMAINRWRSPQGDSDQLSLSTPEPSTMERWFPLLFVLLSLLIVLGLTYYTLVSMGLI